MNDQIVLNEIDFAYSNSLNNFKLDDISLTINHGDFISILGPNGSGKSTLIKIIAGILKPSKGKILLENKNLFEIKRNELAKKISYVPQSNYTVFPFSVEEIVAMGRTPYLNYFGTSGEKDYALIKDALEIFEISHLKEKGINEVSGGETQRAFLARAFVQDPEILLLDEPNAHLDLKHQIGIYKILEELNENRKLTVIIISHDLNLSAYFTKKGVLMSDGKIFKDDVIENVLTQENIKLIFNVNSTLFRDKNNKLNIKINPE